LWHGAAWNFVIWGLVFFCLLMIEKTGLGKWLENTKVIGHLIVVFIIPITWVVFGITDFQELGSYIMSMFGVHSAQVLAPIDQFFRLIEQYWWLLAICFVMATPYPMKIYRRFKASPFMIPVLTALFVLSVHEIRMGSNNPFLYFRF
jgi:alginate O-acetyltransferase complex protein AlgI